MSAIRLFSSTSERNVVNYKATIETPKTMSRSLKCVLLVAAGGLSFLLSACASDTADKPPGVADQKLVCTYERPTGSHVRVRNCRTPAQIEAERQQAREAMDEIDRVQSTTSPDS